MAHKTVQALKRGLQIMELLSRNPQGVELKAIANEVQVSSAAAHHLVMTLIDSGYAQKKESPVRFLLGDQISVLARGQQLDGVEKQIHSAMLCMNEKLPEVSLYFAKNIGSQVIVKDQILPSSPGLIQKNVFHTLPPYISVGGTVHMAWWSDEDREAHEAQYPFESYGALFWGSYENYQGVLEDLRDRGYFYLPSINPKHLRLGVPIKNGQGVFIGSLTVQWNQNSDQEIETKKELLAKITISEIQHLNI